MTKEAGTAVFWDIYRCSVPSADDASLVAPLMNSALKDLGYSGPITITAVGILTRVPLDILRAVYSSGVSLTYVNTEFSGIDSAMMSWDYNQRKLGKHDNIMLLSTEPSFRASIGHVQSMGHKIIQELPFNDPSPPFPWTLPLVHSWQSLDPWNPLSLQAWQSFSLAGVCFPPLLSDPPGWRCASCRLDGKAFEDLVSHLKENHVTHQGDPDPINTWPCLPKRNKQPMRKCKKQKV